MLKDKPFRHENINGVYVIASYTEKIEQPPVVEVKRYYTFSGTIRDADSEEGLPYAYITTPEKTVSTDEAGYFSFKTEKKEISVYKCSIWAIRHKILFFLPD